MLITIAPTFPSLGQDLCVGSSAKYSKGVSVANDIVLKLFFFKLKIRKIFEKCQLEYLQSHKNS